MWHCRGHKASKKLNSGLQLSSLGELGFTFTKTLFKGSPKIISWDGEWFRWTYDAFERLSSVFNRRIHPRVGLWHVFEVRHARHLLPWHALQELQTMKCILPHHESTLKGSPVLGIWGFIWIHHIWKTTWQFLTVPNWPGRACQLLAGCFIAWICALFGLNRKPSVLLASTLLRIGHEQVKFLVVPCSCL